ncbi:MAG: DUF6483 family protein [Oscillospiraceae bacterium]
MLFQSDWFMRQIQMMVQFIARVIFKKDFIEYEIENEDMLTEDDILYRRIFELVDKNMFCDAEDLLFQSLCTSNLQHLKISLCFYNELNKFDDSALESADFPRDEIESGLKDIIRLYDLTDIIGSEDLI